MPNPNPKIDRTKPAFLVAERFGGVVAFANALGKAPSTCHRWLESGLIPSRHMTAVLEAARERKIKLKAQDFIPQAETETTARSAA